MQPIDDNLFRKTLGRFASGVTVVTVKTEAGEPHGMTASAFSSLSLEPPLVLVCVKKENQTWKHLVGAEGFAVNLLSRTMETLSNRFAGGTVSADGQWTPWPEEKSKFTDVSFSLGTQSGAALLEGCLGHLDCSMEQVLDGGDHSIFVGRVHSAAAGGDSNDEPLIYFSGRYRQLESEEGENKSVD